MADLIPLEVTAHLAHGIAHALPWGISLDGLLAAELWADMKAEARERGEDLTVDPENPIDLDLPLARCTLAGRDWHWAATCAYPQLAHPDPEIRYWTARAEHRQLERTAHTVPTTISDRQGRYRARHMPLIVTSAASVRWGAVGDLEAIEAILCGIDAIGKKRSSGDGRVIRWVVEPAPELTYWEAAHSFPNGQLGRLAPMDCLIDHPDCDHGPAAVMGLRPPYMHAARRAPVVQPLPELRRTADG